MLACKLYMTETAEAFCLDNYDDDLEQEIACCRKGCHCVRVLTKSLQNITNDKSTE